MLRKYLDVAYLQGLSMHGTVKNYLSVTGQTRAEFLHGALAMLKEIIREADTL